MERSVMVGEWSGISLDTESQSRPRTLSEVVTRQLREAIIRGRLRPGQPLWQDRLADEFGVSRVPIRESLRQLASEGLVTLKSHRSAIVAELSRDEIEELYTMMTTLEVLAAPRSVERLTDADIESMAQLMERMEKEKKEPIDWYLLSGEFHRVFVAASGWMHLVETVDLCRKNVMRYVNVREYFQSQREAWNRRNAAMLRACRARDTERVVASLEDMGNKASRAARNYLSKKLISKPAQRSKKIGA